MIIYGKQVCLYVLEKHRQIIEEIYFDKDIDKALFRRFAMLNKPIIRVDSKKMQALARGGNHQGFLLKVSDISQSNFNFFKDSSKIIVLVGITDVGNIGSIFRSALAFGIDGIISTMPINESGVARSSSGAFFDVPYIVYKDYMNLLNELKMSKFDVFGTSSNGLDYKKTSDKWALFFGSEGEGLPNRLIRRLDSVLSIKMKQFDSLNVSVAAGILIYRMVNDGMY